MEEIFEEIYEAIARVAESEFTWFKSRHEIRLKQAPSISNRISEETLLEVSKDPFLQSPDVYTKEKLFEFLSVTDQEYLEIMVLKRDERAIAKEFNPWKEFILNSKKQEYLNQLITDYERSPNVRGENVRFQGIVLAMA